MEEGALMRRRDADSGAAEGMKHCVREARTKTDEERKVRKTGKKRME